MFFQFCDALEVKDGQVAGANGWGLEHALNAWGAYWKDTYYALSELSKWFAPTAYSQLAPRYQHVEIPIPSMPPTEFSGCALSD